MPTGRPRWQPPAQASLVRKPCLNNVGDSWEDTVPAQQGQLIFYSSLDLWLDKRCKHMGMP